LRARAPATSFSLNSSRPGSASTDWPALRRPPYRVGDIVAAGEQKAVDAVERRFHIGRRLRMRTSPPTCSTDAGSLRACDTR
jgi:hypothetical protein